MTATTARAARAAKALPTVGSADARAAKATARSVKAAEAKAKADTLALNAERLADTLASRILTEAKAAEATEAARWGYFHGLADAILGNAMSAKSHADRNAAKIAKTPTLAGRLQTSPDTITQYVRAAQLHRLGGLPVDMTAAKVVSIATQAVRAMGTEKVDLIITEAQTAKATAAATVTRLNTDAEAARKAKAADAEAAKVKAEAEAAKATKATEAKAARKAKAEAKVEAARPRTAAEYLSEAASCLAAAKAAGFLASDAETLRSIVKSVTDMLAAPVTPRTVAKATEAAKASA